ncbi:urease accessory protein UreD [Polymorphobacter glacialis]|uniref:Urease accessory protein UreD n=1 Tax=Sandarakinorhabdus glacialis TaxID=1614636 RepID=A0A916ZPZ6_9SPHN|nr:urease accessory protein UreD [Polymorphobacter glacialis]GGE07331.1 urease accessory protein UreD [Polymorphobacter glacialis]
MKSQSAAGESLPPPRHQRVDGAARLAVGKNGLTDLYQRAPCRLLFPDTEPGEPLQAVSLTTTGGLTGGDRIAFELDIAADAAATLTTQAAERLYRVHPGDPDILIDTVLTIGDRGWGEWLAQEAILYDGTRVRRRFQADVAASGRMLAVESLVFGRTAMGETIRTGRIHDSWHIRRNGRLVWVDALHLEGDIAAQMAAPFAFGDANSTATILYVGPDAADHLTAVRTLIDGAQGGATIFDGLLIVRLLSADAAALRRSVIRIVAGLRHLAGGYLAAMPNVWHC